jgi:hypothetical protein
MTRNESDKAVARSNHERACRADVAFIVYGSGPENSTDEERLTGLLADLQHLARREGWDFDAAERMAAGRFLCEVAEEEKVVFPDLLHAARCALADLEGFLFDYDIDPADPAQADVPAVRTVRELKAAVARAEGGDA